jgi:NAD(P)-dependent dehydrogenase (short-subunit alcohol dehydrogenase family)
VPALGIGQAVSRLLVKEGAKVAVTDVLDEAGRTLATELSSSTSSADEWIGRRAKHVDNLRESLV